MNKEQTQNKKLSTQFRNLNRKLNILKINNNKKVSLSLFLSVLPSFPCPSYLPLPTTYLESYSIPHSLVYYCLF